MPRLSLPSLLLNSFWTLCLLSSGLPAWALDREVGLANTHHTSWTVLDGAPSRITAMAQTPDGWLWLGAYDGLYRFDGLRFTRVELPRRGMLAHDRIAALGAERDGRLTITYAGFGMSMLHPDGRLEELPDTGPSLGPILSTAIDVDGSIWIGAYSGVHRFDGKRWVPVPFDGVPEAGGMHNMLVDQYGQMWASDR
ncbi:ligand-binding sensor domain-containing protein [Massilia oculi]|uniref:ligand-binding sensor domain-containing protein n=1 Tax=Massilia oculi TaxID=945844 RepID=UPI001AAF990E|nr:two-component regulator propeller domain-containing protein [Massilia oculi]